MCAAAQARSPAQLSLADRRQNTAPVAKNMRLYFGCYLVRETLFEEALEQFKGLEPGEVVDPASLLFCEAVAYHGLVHRDEGLKAAERLLQDEQQTPKRYVALARLIEEDLKGVEEESLDHIARRMEDIRRRLDLGRAGPRSARSKTA